MKLEDFADEVCNWCGEDFESRRVDQKYCSSACQRAASKAFEASVISEERRRARAGRTCQQCGAKFDAARKDQIYCSKRCTDRAGYDAMRRRKGLPPLAVALASLRCEKCGGPIDDPLKTDTKYCSNCIRPYLRADRISRRNGSGDESPDETKMVT